MNSMWHNVMKPIIEAVKAKYIVEIGSDTGKNTKNILEYCMKHNAHMTAIDPVPKFDVEEFKTKYGEKFEIYKELSLEQLPFLQEYDVILVDGDHNWYTVYNELKIIEKTFKDKKFPVVFLHDVGWPYGRRDLYYDPDNIPEQFRQPYKQLGMYPGESELRERGGLNPHLNNAIHENTPKNGVLTALEDFVKESNLELLFEIIPIFSGLAVLYSDNDVLKKIVKNIIQKTNFAQVLEEDRFKSILHSKYEFERLNQQIQRIELEKLKQKQENKLTKDHYLKLQEQLKKDKQIVNQLKNTEILVKEKERQNKVLKNKYIQIKEKDHELQNEVKNLRTELLEMEYLSNINRSWSQRLVSKFPSLFIILKIYKTGFKNALSNIKGYRSIKKNNLFDLGYYLKNNKDVRTSNKDPILHYIYYGFKESRNPNPEFNNNYYMKKYKDVQKSNLNPLIHYSLFGLEEGRKTNLYNLERKFKVSIVMPTYNRKNIIKRAINSILNQTFTNYELIICDDGSTDGTEELLKQDYANHFESGKFIYLKEEHGGVSKARNICLESSSGNLIAYLDTDNTWESEFLEKIVNLFLDSKCDSAYAALEVHNQVENRNYYLNKEYDRDSILNANYIDINIFIHRRELYELFGGFNESLKRLVDWDIILRYTKNKDPLFFHEVLAHYYVKKDYNNISLQNNFEEHLDKIYELHTDEIIGRAVSKSNFITDPFSSLLYLKSKNPIVSNDLKVAVIMEGELKSLKSCPYLRLYAPLKNLSLKDGFKIFIYDRFDFADLDVNDTIKNKVFDVIIIQRGAVDVESAKILLKKCKNNNIKVIYEFDDDLLSIDENNKNYAFFKSRIMSMDYLIKNADLLTVTTNALSDRFSDLTKTLIVRNYLVDELKPITPVETKENGNSFDIGYYGTLTHDHDLLMIKDPITKITKKFKEKYDIDVKFHVIGGMNQEHQQSWFNKVVIPDDVTDFVPFMKWIKDNVNYDIMLAPLRDTDFNKSKSELKYIEYSALGIPGIYSNLPPYNSVIQDGINGLLAKNTEEWEDKIEKLFLDKNLRTKIVENAQMDLKENYLMEYKVEEWQNMLQNIVANFKISIVLPVYNMEKYLRHTLESIERQTIGLKNLEVIMVNEASSDGSKLIMDEYSNKYKNFISVHLNESSGTPGKPRNIGMEMARGEYIMFIDHDDFYSNDACEVLYNKISEEGADIVSGIYNFVHGNEIRKLYDKKIFDNKPEIKFESIDDNVELLTLPPVVWSKIFRRKFIMENSLQFPVGILAEDLIFLSEALLKAKGIVFLNHPVYNYRVLNKKGETSLSQTRGKQWFKDVFDARKMIWDAYQREGKEKYFKQICTYSLDYLLTIFLKSNLDFNDKYEILDYMYWIFEKSHDYGILPLKKYQYLFNLIIEKDFKNAIQISEILRKYHLI